MLNSILLGLCRADILILYGGQGSAQNNYLTREVVAKAMGISPPEDRDSNKEIKDMPEGGIILENHNQSVSKYLKEIKSQVLYSHIVKICGIDESKVEMEILDLIKSQTNPTIGIHVKTGEVHLEITGKAGSILEAKGLVTPVIKELSLRFGDNIYSMRKAETLEDVVVNQLRKHGWKVTTVESCTGGMLSARIINVSGASQVFEHGFVTYSNRAKVSMVGVSEETLLKYKAVSEEVAKEMALGALNLTGDNIAISITGVAGPEKEDDKPVGLVYIGCVYKDTVKVWEFHFHGNRQNIREQAVVSALDILRRNIK